MFPGGTVYSTAQQVIVQATSLLYYILLFRILNLADIGQISLLTATTAIFTTLTQPALPDPVDDSHSHLHTHHATTSYFSHLYG